MEELEGFNERYRFASEAHNGVFILALQSNLHNETDYTDWRVVNYTKVSFRDMKKTTSSYVCGCLLPKGAPE